MRSAFVSHSTKDDYYVAELESLLRAAGFDDVFNDVSSIKPDEQFWPEIERGIGACDTLFVVITAASNDSDWVKREVECARRLGKKVVPLWVEDCPVPAIFQGRDVIDLRPRTRQARRIDISRIGKYAPAELIGREAETKILTDAWGQAVRAESNRPHVLTFVALGGEGKTSLVAKWAASLADDNWPGCDAVFAWSFYSQGTREQTAVSSDLFLTEALTFFGDAAMAGSAQGAFEKGRRLAQLVGERRALLILDGLEPLQYAPTSPTPGELKDQGLRALLKGLAATSHGLCVVTTRYALPDLRAYLGGTVREEKLARLARAAGVQLLKAHGVIGSDRRNLPLHDGDANSELVSEFEKLVEDVKGHALTLNLLGTYLRDAHAGDIRKRDLVKLEEADAEEQGGHAFHVMDAYVRWLESGTGVPPVNSPGSHGQDARATQNGQRALALLRLMGLFDRPATADCLAALWQAPAIPGLTEPLIGLSGAQRNLSLKRLEDAKLLTVNRDASGTLISLDAHPLLREYFAEKLKSSPLPPREESGAPTTEKTLDASKRHAAAEPSAHLAERDGYSAWREAHRRLYEHLCASTQEGDQPTLEALQPLYQAVAHGCQAGLQQEACDKVFNDRILRGDTYYSSTELGALGSDLGAVACFFETSWRRIAPALLDATQTWLLNEAGFGLRALGRLSEAREPMRAGLNMGVKAENWKAATRSASNLSELELTLGEIAAAVRDAEHSVTYADRSKNRFWQVANRTTHADALHQAGRRVEAEARFREAEHMQAEDQPNYPLLYLLEGFVYCDLLLVEGERAAWQNVVQGFSPSTRTKSETGTPREERTPDELKLGTTLAALRPVSERAAQTLKIAERKVRLLDIALDHLTLGRAALYAAILESPSPSPLNLYGEATGGGQTATGEGGPAPGHTARLHLPPSALEHIESAVSGLRHSGRSDILPHALLTRAWQRSLTGALTSAQAGPDSAQSDLDEAWEIAERGPMRLHMADIHLHRARLFGMSNDECRMTNGEPLKYPWESPEKDLAEARKLIVACGYGRRIPELEDAEKALKGMG